MTTALGDDADSESLGPRIRRRRLAKGLSVRQLAHEIGCSPSHISQIERGISEPSISILTAIVASLGESMDSLLPDSHGVHHVAEATATSPPTHARVEADLTVQRAAERRRIRIQGGVTSELLLPQVERNADFCEYLYEPGHASSQKDELLRHPGREYGIVLEGQLCVTLKFEEFELEVGDSIAFNSSVPHRFWNPGKTPARVIWFSSPIL